MASHTADDRCLSSRGLLTTTCFFPGLLHRPLSLGCHPSLPKLQASPSLVRPTDRTHRLACLTGLRSFPQRRQHRGTEQVLAKKGTVACAQFIALCYSQGCGFLTEHLSLFYLDHHLTSSCSGCQKNEKVNFLVLIPPSPHTHISIFS